LREALCCHLTYLFFFLSSRRCIHNII
jgi:hypothetical protein